MASTATLTSIALNGMRQFMIYTADPATKQIYETQYNISGGWIAPNPVVKGLPETPTGSLAAVAWNGTDIRIYWQGVSGGIYEAGWITGRGWSQGSKPIAANDSIIGGLANPTPVTAIASFSNGDKDIRVYVQNKHSATYEIALTMGSDWKVGGRPISG